MTTKTKKLIELAERSKGVAGSEKWPVFRCFKTPSGKMRYDWCGRHPGIDFGAKLTLSETEWAIYYGPLLPHNPLDPMNPAACLRRASKLSKEVRVWVNTMLIRTIGAIDAPLLCYIPTYADYMEAILNLHELAKEHGGEWVKAWVRAMTPEVEG